MALPMVLSFLGPPGSGKGTQADMIVEAVSHYRHLNNGRIIESIVMDPKNQDDPIIRRERENFVSGRLCTPSWTLKILKENVEKIVHSGCGVVFSGNPRTREEANELIPFLENLYGADSIAVVHLIVKKKTSIFRNEHRKICKKCAKPLMWSVDSENFTFCSHCGGELVARSLDKPDIIEYRYIEYEHHTESLMPYFVSMGLPVIDIDGEPLPEMVHMTIMKELKTRFQ